jgi:hypothetical protein
MSKDRLCLVFSLCGNAITDVDTSRTIAYRNIRVYPASKCTRIIVYLTGNFFFHLLMLDIKNLVCHLQCMQ